MSALKGKADIGAYLSRCLFLTQKRLGPVQLFQRVHRVNGSYRRTCVAACAAWVIPTNATTAPTT
jgi:hypothetical protein